jgi:hypothetical protein
VINIERFIFGLLSYRQAKNGVHLIRARLESGRDLQRDRDGDDGSTIGPITCGDLSRFAASIASSSDAPTRTMYPLSEGAARTRAFTGGQSSKGRGHSSYYGGIDEQRIMRVRRLLAWAA